MMAILTQQLRQANIGRKILRDWLGADGVPVPIEQAQARANVCLNCPKNYGGEWLWNMATSMTINARMKLRYAMNLKLQGDDKLGVCEVCGCKLLLKVHCPMKHMARYTTPEMLSKYPSFCWMKTENNNHTTT